MTRPLFTAAARRERRRRWIVWAGMAAAHVAVAGAAFGVGWTAAKGQTMTVSTQGRMTSAPGDGACVAYVEIVNRAGHYHATETVVTAAGAVSIRYETVGGHRPGDDDKIEVVALPDGFFLRTRCRPPSQMATPRGCACLNTLEDDVMTASPRLADALGCAALVALVLAVFGPVT